MCVCVCVCARACEQERQLILGSQDHLVKVRTPFISYSVRLAAATPHTHCFSSAAFCVSAGDVNSAPSVPSGPPMGMGACSYGRRPALSVVWGSVGGSSVNWLSIHTQTRTPIAKLSALMSWQVPAFWGYQTLPSQHWASTLILELAVHMSSVEWGGYQCGYNCKGEYSPFTRLLFHPLLSSEEVMVGNDHLSCMAALWPGSSVDEHSCGNWMGGCYIFSKRRAGD